MRVVFQATRLCLLLTLASFTTNTGVFGEDGYTLYAPFSMKGMFGNITFYQNSVEDNVTISVHLEIIPPDDPNDDESDPSPEEFKWSIQSFPVTYDTKELCQRDHLGSILHNLEKEHGQLTLSINETEIEFIDATLKLVGQKTIWGRSILLTSSKRVKYCANIITLHEVKTAKAKIFSPIAGDIIIRENQYSDTTIFTNLFNIGDAYTSSAEFPWRVLVSDVLDRNANKGGGQESCNYLRSIFDPDGIDGSNCSESSHKACKVGQLTGKHGGVKIGSTNSRNSRKFFVDTHYPIIDFEGIRSTFVVVYGNDLKIMACGKISIIKPRDLLARFSSDDVRGYIRFTQESPYDPTIVAVNLDNLQNRGKGYHIHEFPKPYQLDENQPLCTEEAVGGHFNPFQVDKEKSPLPGFGTTDQYEVGDLSGKFGFFEGNTITAHYVDFNLPMYGMHNIVGRSVVIHYPTGGRWICANIEYMKEITTAIATFYYPVIGQIILRQEKDNPFAETTVFAELSYNDGTRKNTMNHRWGIHMTRPGKDYYDWQNRCASVNDEYNPYHVGKSSLYKYCRADNPFRCSLGDLTKKIGRVDIAAQKGSIRNKFFKTDLNLALSGINNVIGRSFIIYDDNAPSHRGDKLACTTIFQEHPIKAQVKTWKTGVGEQSRVSGTFTFFQQTRDDPTHVDIEIDGLEKMAGGYHIHKWPVPDYLEFPCTNDAVSGHFNPFNISAFSSPSPATGSLDTYEIGDLSGKYGMMNQYSSFSFSTVDTSLSLRGVNSILGRSIVIHKVVKNYRWMCGNVELDTKIAFPQKVVALASFDQLEGFLRGYVRLTQLVYPGGGSSDTVVEVMLRYPGKNNRNVTTNHKWSAYVNQVGADASVRSEKTRCIAAGYLWNPYLVVSGDETTYNSDCNAHNPLRCQMGDLTGRHGLLTVGVGRQVFSDINLPLYGNASVVGRSIVIHSKNGSPNSLGCANIILERHIVHKVTIRRPSSFGSQEFMDTIREALDSFEWLMYSEAHSQRLIDDGNCVELTIHFKGPDARGLSQEFKDLMNTGKINKHTRLGVKRRKILYRLCTQGTITIYYSNFRVLCQETTHNWKL
ncbi:Cell surface superoxide dismutase [Cu-Zn] 6 [Nymphon striatum]|nr:Cell surface superoxide dismutase [Cu-Zn] 6 [Nymphon striatum]